MSEQEIQLDAIGASPTNPRKLFEEQKLRELAADILANGLLQAVTVRPKGDGRYELVVGERRVRASRLAGLTTIQARVREMTDRQVLEAQISENGQREDVHPLEEADGFLNLASPPHNVPVEEIAAHIGMRPAYVQARLALARMIPAAREAFLAGKLSTGIASLVARMGTEGDQAKAVEAFLAPSPYYNSPDRSWTVQDAGRWIRQHFHLRIANAPFDVTNAELVTGTPACAACPKNTATQMEMFSDVREAECTDTACWQRKATATWNAMTEGARERGLTVLSLEESAKALPHSATYPANGYARLDEKPHQFAEGRRSWAQLLKDHLPPVVVARGPNGELVEVVRPEDLKAAVKAAGLGKRPKEESERKAGGGTKSSSTKAPKGKTATYDAKAEQAQRDAIETAVRQAAIDAMQAKTFTDPDNRALWQWIARGISVMGDGYLTDEVFARRDGVAPEEFRKRPIQKREASIAEEISMLSGSGCRVLIVELFLAHGEARDELGKATLAFLKVDRAKVEAKVKATATAPKVEPTKTKPAAKILSSKSKPITKPAAKKPAAKGKGR